MRGDWVWWQRPTCRQFAQVKQMHRFDEASCCSTCPATHCPSTGSQIVNQHSIEQEVGTIAELLLVSTADTTPASPADLLPHFFRGQCVLDHTSAKVSSPPLVPCPNNRHSSATWLLSHAQLTLLVAPRVGS